MSHYHVFVLGDPVESVYVEDTGQGYLAARKSLGRDRRDRVIGYRAVKPGSSTESGDGMLLQGDGTDETGRWIRDTWRDGIHETRRDED
jgi:hypothetical protein